MPLIAKIPIATIGPPRRDVLVKRKVATQPILLPEDSSGKAAFALQPWRAEFVTDIRHGWVATTIPVTATFREEPAGLCDCVCEPVARRCVHRFICRSRAVIEVIASSNSGGLPTIIPAMRLLSRRRSAIISFGGHQRKGSWICPIEAEIWALKNIRA